MTYTYEQAEKRYADDPRIHAPANFGPCGPQNDPVGSRLAMLAVIEAAVADGHVVDASHGGTHVCTQCATPGAIMRHQWNILDEIAPCGHPFKI